ncbi:MAG: DUF502 domain-containing protein, partial [Candidatus Aureabacteria bacterium]|nr:DUF502 domain-containing protein [Candidatus Auribacterota bacterium]
MTGNEKKDEEKKGIWSSVAFRKNFLTGLFIILPIALSVSVFVFVINFILGLFRVDQIIKLISKLIERMGFEKIDAAWLKVYLILALIVFIISIIYLIGLFARYIFMRKIISLMDKILYKIPIFNKIYMTVKQIAVAFKSARATIFKNVVLIEYPRKGLYTLGFLTMKARGQ